MLLAGVGSGTQGCALPSVMFVGDPLAGPNRTPQQLLCPVPQCDAAHVLRWQLLSGCSKFWHACIMLLESAPRLLSAALAALAACLALQHST